MICCMIHFFKKRLATVLTDKSSHFRSIARLVEAQDCDGGEVRGDTIGFAFGERVFTAGNLRGFFRK